jgi:NADH dehydrogenase [ubiquinone] 1 alpha subcomplex assembly factor 7
MTTRTAPLEAEIRRRIAASGAIPVAEYMALCLGHPQYGYYVAQDPLGAEGDFTTSPEISQMFGELIGLWAAAVWPQMGSPSLLRLIELGPGRGTLMADALRAAHVVPEFRAALSVHMVEISPVLEQRQRAALNGVDIPTQWHSALGEVPDGPAIIIANEFFDALPVQQAVMCADGWHERVVRIGKDGAFEFGHARDPIPLFDQMVPPSARNAQIGAIFEWRPDQVALELGRRVARQEGAALVIDYGHLESAIGDTLQAVGWHAFADPLATPGLVDLTAHVDFDALGRAAESMGARMQGPIDQSTFLRELGIKERADALRKGAPPDKAADIEAALERLISEERTGMGRLFKVAGFAHRKVGLLPGFP